MPDLIRYTKREDIPVTLKKKKIKKTGASEQRELRTRVYGHESENE